MPPSTTRPPARVASIASCTASPVPAISKATSTPSPTTWPRSPGARTAAGSRAAAAPRPAGAAPDRRVDRDPVAPPGAVLDHAGGLVAEHHRGRQGRVADLTLVPPVQVRAADADRGHPHQAHPRPGLRYRLLGQPDIARPVQPRGLHV